MTGLEMIKAVKEISEDLEFGVSVKIGIHTGKVIAGIIGTRPVNYDIFGEGVQITHNILSQGNPGKLYISEKTF